jgi:DNA-binding transcriptional MerR regulator
MMSAELFGTGDVAELTKLPRRRLQYLLGRGDLPDPSHVVGGRRIFTLDDVRKIHAALSALPAGRAKQHTGA